MIKTIIVEDDFLQNESLVQMIKKYFNNVDIIASCSNVPDAFNKIMLLKPELIFLDIELGSLSGFDLLDMVEERDFEVIFTTYHNKYAVQAIKTSALDYIEKPVDVTKLAEALKIYKKRSGALKVDNLLANLKTDLENQRIALPDKDGHSFFLIKDVIHCQSDNSYTEFYIKSDKKDKDVIKIVVSKGFDHYADYLEEMGLFYRVHNRHIVNINHIKRHLRGEDAYLIMDDKIGSMIPIARARKDDFLYYLKRRGIIL